MNVITKICIAINENESSPENDNDLPKFDWHGLESARRSSRNSDAFELLMHRHSNVSNINNNHGRDSIQSNNNQFNLNLQRHSNVSNNSNHNIHGNDNDNAGGLGCLNMISDDMDEENMAPNNNNRRNSQPFGFSNLTRNNNNYSDNNNNNNGIHTNNDQITFNPLTNSVKKRCNFSAKKIKSTHRRIVTGKRHCNNNNKDETEMKLESNQQSPKSNLLKKLDVMLLLFFLFFIFILFYFIFFF